MLGLDGEAACVSKLSASGSAHCTTMRHLVCHSLLGGESCGIVLLRASVCRIRRLWWLWRLLLRLLLLIGLQVRVSVYVLGLRRCLRLGRKHLLLRKMLIVRSRIVKCPRAFRL